MRFKEFYSLHEKFLGNFKIENPVSSRLPIHVEVFDNPSRKEIAELLNDFFFVRIGATDEAKPKIYIWEGNVVHFDVAKVLLEKKKIKMAAGGVISKNDDVFKIDQTKPIDKLKTFVGWEKYKNKKAFLEKMKFLSPKIKTVHLTFNNKKFPIEELV